MAEWGKGDEKWIVQDRADGANVNQWHWSEKDCMRWAEARIKELFTGTTLTSGGALEAKITAVDSVTGEAFLNVRKAKLIPSYELSVSLLFSGTVSNGDGSLLKAVEGKVVLPYIAEENHDEDPEIKVALTEEDPASMRLKEAILLNGKKAICEKIKVFVDDFHAGKPAGHESAPAVDAANGKGDAGAAKASSSAAPASAASSSKAPASSSPKDSVARGLRSIVVKEEFYAGRKDIYDALTNEHRIRAFTQSDASVSNDVGGAFSMFGGSIEGIHRELVPGQRIVQDWRFKNWQDGLYSKVTISIEEPEPGRTKVVMTQEGIPDEDKFGNLDVVQNTEHGWRNLIFYRIKAVFGYGL